MSISLITLSQEEESYIVGVSFNSAAFTAIQTVGMKVQPMPGIGTGPSPGLEYIVLPRAFGLFNYLRITGDIKLR